MVYHLQNDKYRVSVQEKGAELSSFYAAADQIEYIWSAGAVWPRHAPVLFPVVGKLPGNQYQFDGKTFSLPQHGFARDEVFQLSAQTAHSVTFALNSSEKTRVLYPFDFRLEISYTLEVNRLEVGYRVQNPGQTDLLFSIGGHPGFNCPLLPGEQFEDYYLQFEKPETQHRYLLHEGLQNGQTELVLQEEACLPLRYELFQQDAIVLKGLSSRSISLKTKKHGHGLNFDFAGFPFFGIWTKEPGAPFICLEPWHGIAGRVGESGALAEKEGILKLGAGEEFNCSYGITVF